MRIPTADILAARQLPSAAAPVVSSVEDSAHLQRILPTILLLDDDPFMLAVHSQALQSMGYDHISTAGSAEAALTQLRCAQRPVDVIVSDLNMPFMDGIEFLQIVDAAGFSGSVILLSGEGARVMHTVQKLLSGGGLVILGAIEKPANRVSLRALLDCWKPRSEAGPSRSVPLLTPSELSVAQREQQWLLHYQPKVDLRTGALSGMEALVRWRHPVHGLLPPDSFIGLAEDCGLIDDLTDWVLREAMEQLCRWQQQGLRIQMSINLSMENLRAPDFARRVGQMARQACASPQDITLEITESRLMSRSPAPLESLVRLRLQRFGLSIDDFGTGHSSLVQLRDVPFTELKIDRGFVQGARNNQIIRPILEGSIGIAQRMGMLAVAEGVETEADWQFLRETGCDLAQGWFIGRAMPAEQVLEWAQLWESRLARLTGS